MLARDISDLKVAQRELEHLATHDYLTGLPNRSLFNERLDDAVARHKRSGESVAVLFCDLDGFKRVNDEFGHAAGDQLLVEVASRLRSITRASETAARVGGDEFVLVVTEVADNEELASLAERVIHAVASPVDLDDGNEVKVGISVGVGVAWQDQPDVESDRLLTVADTAMYQAKARGGKTFRIAVVD
jgi:diguanylate cyclase (GGDEF)-like protein